MGALLEIGATILAQATGRAEVTAQNIANIATPGYRRRISFDKIIGGTDPLQQQNTALAVVADLTAGKQIETGNPYDLAIGGNGYFTVASEAGPLYTRQGQFERDADGRLVTPQGFALQGEGGSDVILNDAPFEVHGDGVVVQEGAPVAKLALVEILDPRAASHGPGGLMRVAEEAVVKARAATIRQGALESSNVSTAEEMVALMAATRRAETAQRIIGTYDDLMGRALAAFGQS